MGDWYVKNLWMLCREIGGEPTHARFLMDAAGVGKLEVYRNPKVSVPEYNSMDPLLMHLAFVSNDPSVDPGPLVAAGARVVEDLTNTPAGTSWSCCGIRGDACAAG